MKRMLAALAAAAVISGPLAIATAQAETILRYGEADVGDLDPQTAVLIQDGVLMYNMYDTLVFPGLDGKSTEIKPHLAESYTIDPTGTVYTFKLRPNVKFQSGNPLTAADVVYSMNRMLALKRGNSFLFDGWVKSSVAKDPLTVEFTMTAPYVTFYSSLVRLFIVDGKTAKANQKPGNYGENGDYSYEWLNNNSAGTGAYYAVFHKRDERTDIRKNPNYFLGVSPKAPDLVRIFWGVSDATVLTMFQRGEMDLVRFLIQTETKQQLMKVPGVTMVAETGISQFFIKPNNTKAPFDDVHCRRALAWALDYEAMMSVEDVTPEIKGAIPSKGPLLDSMPGYDPSIPPFAKRDMAKAKAELAKCKHKPGSVKIQITWMSPNTKQQRLALLMQQNWKELGFDSEIESRIWAQWTAQTAKAETAPMIAQVYTTARTPDPDAYLYNIYHSSRHGQFSASEYFKDAEVDRLLDEGRKTNPGPARDEIYRKVVNRVVDLQPSIFGYQQVNLYPKRDTFFWPNLEKPNMNTGIMSANMLFRLMEMKGSS